MYNIKGYVSKYLGLNNIFDTSAFPFAGIDDIVTERGGIAQQIVWNHLQKSNFD